jgi:phosphoglycerate dehydrogenase-like enzyme
VIVWSATEANPDELRTLLHPGVELVQLDSAGVEDWLESGVVDEHRVWVAAQGAYADALAEHALALLLAAAKRLPQAARADAWREHRTRRLAGSTVGLVGAGGIARRLVELLDPFRAAVLAVNRSGAEVPGAAETVGSDGLHDVLARSDYVVLSAPLTPATRHLIGKAELERIGAEGWLINVGRGGVVDTDALVAALHAGRLGGACLDVTDPEPLPQGHPLWSMPNVLVTPHAANPLGSHLHELAARVEENLRRHRSGQPLLGVIDVERGY